MNEKAREGRNKQTLWSIMDNPVWKSLSSPARLIYVVLDKHFGGKDICWPSFMRIKEFSGYKTDQTISKALTELEEKGIITKEKRGQGKANRYHKSKIYLKTTLLNEEQELHPVKGSSSPNEEEPLQQMETNNNMKNKKNNNSEQEELAADLCAMGLEEKKARAVIGQYEPDHIIACMDKAREKASTNPAGYFHEIIDKETPKDPAKIREEKSQAMKRKGMQERKEQEHEWKKEDQEEEQENWELDRAYERFSEEEKAEVDKRAKKSQAADKYKAPEKVYLREAIKEYLEEQKISRDPEGKEPDPDPENRPLQGTD